MTADPSVALYLKAALLGLVEGVTEFIPVSSTGHLIVAGDWVGYTGERSNVFKVFIQLGAILAIVWLYRARLAATAAGLRSDPAARRLAANMAIAFLPAAVIGFLADDWIDAHLFRPETVAAALIAGGVAMLLIERRRRPPSVESVDAVRPATALGIGLAQVLALFPGVSRSGATIMGGYVLGLSRTAATEFSFFLAIPVMVAATLYKLVKARHLLTAADAPVFTIGFIVAFLSALVVVRAFLGFVAHRSFAVFAWYRIAFGLALFAMYGLSAA